MEWKLEKKDREERKKNILIKGLEEKERRRREMAEEVIKKMGIEVDIKEIKRIEGDREKNGVGKEMVLKKLEKKEQKRRIVECKKKLRERKEIILEDWT